MLVYNKADPSIKNYQGVSALDLANEMNEDYIFEILKNPLNPKKMTFKLKKEGVISLIFDIGKSKDEKLNNYIKGYQINNYKQEYNYLLKEIEYNYTPIKYNNNNISNFVDAYIDLYKTDSPNPIKIERSKRRS